MSIETICEKLNCSGIEFCLNEPMSRHTSFKIGGVADIFVQTSSAQTAATVLTLCKEENVPITVIGNGSNILVSDKGIEGLVLRFFCSKTEIVSNGDGIILVSAGLPLSFVCRKAMQNSLKGMEFAYGIPGTIGGALFMNAGAYGGKMKDIVLSAEVLMPDGEIITIPADKMELDYRHSIFKTNGGIILSVTLKLQSGDSKEIEENMNAISERRKREQPLEFPSAGSVFKHPKGYYAGALIEQSGLKGKRIGGAEVSAKHSGFIVNRGGATCRDVLELIEFIKDTVFRDFGVTLEPEIRAMGR